MNMSNYTNIIKNLEKLIGKKLDKVENTKINTGIQISNNKLVGLNLNRCDLTNIPESIGELKDLTILVLSENELKKIPDSICELEKLEILNLNRNQIKILPRKIGNLNKLRYLFILNNPLDRLPTSLRKFADLYTNLVEIKVKYYGWTGSSRDTMNMLEERGVKITQK